jgi:hypothetical protein
LNNKQTLQNFIFPVNTVFGSQEKYYRSSGVVFYDGNSLKMRKGSVVSFDTYYNAFSVPLWGTSVGITEADLSISGNGKIKIELVEYTENYFSKKVSEETMSLDSAFQEAFHVKIEKSEFTGLLFAKIIALEDTEIQRMSWETGNIPLRNVKLGITITHYNRKQYVIPAMKRIKENLLDSSDWANKINFQVVDNSRNITEEESMGVRIIPNENTGGSGGFTEGFLYYKNNTDVTHVLFMDDDASLEIESVKRAYSILQFAKNDNAAVGAALFYEEHPNVFIERGAFLGDVWVDAEFHDLDSTDIKILMDSEVFWQKHPRKRPYIGWWFCAFPVKDTKRLVPPFFIRGDDVSFTQINNYDIIFGNGIACYAEGFTGKTAPMTEYLDTINPFIVNALFVGRPRKVFAFYKSLYLSALFGARYQYVELYRLALKDFLKSDGQQMIDRIKGIPTNTTFKDIISTEILKNIDLEDYNIANWENEGESRLSTRIRQLTLNRQFLPLNNKKVILQEYSRIPFLQSISGYRNILYFNSYSQKGFVAKVDRWKTIKFLLLFVVDHLKYAFLYRGARKRLLRDYDKLTSEEMWQDILK